MIETEVLIVGGGAAGLTAAIELSQNHKVSVISKETIIDSSRQKSMPYTFEAGCAQIIRAIDEAVMKMSLGERAILDISSGLNDLLNS